MRFSFGSFALVLSVLCLSSFLPALPILFFLEEKENKVVERNLFYICCLSRSPQHSGIEDSFLSLSLLSSSESPHDSTAFPLPLRDLLSHLFIYSISVFLSNTSCLSGLNTLINKLFLDSLHCHGVVLRSAKLCQHRGPSALLLCGFIYIRLSMYRAAQDSF